MIPGVWSLAAAGGAAAAAAAAAAVASVSGGASPRSPLSWRRYLGCCHRRQPASSPGCRPPHAPRVPLHEFSSRRRTLETSPRTNRGKRWEKKRTRTLERVAVLKEMALLYILILV